MGINMGDELSFDIEIGDESSFDIEIGETNKSEPSLKNRKKDPSAKGRDKYVIGVAGSINEHNWFFYDYNTQNDLYRVKRAHVSIRPYVTITDVSKRPKREVAIIREKRKPLVKMVPEDYKDVYQVEIYGYVIGTIDSKMKSLLKTEYIFDYNGWTMIGHPGKKTQIKSGNTVIANIMNSTLSKDVRIEYYDKRHELFIVIMWMTWELAMATAFE